MAAASLLVAVIALTVGCFVYVRVDSSGHTYAAADVPTAPVGLVLGAGLQRDGTPAPLLRARLETARQLLAAGKVTVLLVSGDTTVDNHDQVEAMRTWLIQHGVPTARVVMDVAGLDTYDSCVRARQVFGVRRAIVVTQAFHLPRALYLCRDLGMDAAGVAAPVPGGSDLTNVVREAPASVKALWDSTIHPDPALPGGYDSSVDRALAVS